MSLRDGDIPETDEELEKLLKPKRGKRRDPQYVKTQLAKRAEERKAAEPPEEIALTEPTEAAESAVPTLEDSLSEEARAEVEKFMQNFGETVEVTEAEATPSPEKAAINGALADEKARLATKPKATKAPKAARTPKEPTTLGRDLEGHCRVCGKSLSNEKSVTRGIGPVCYAAMLRQFQWGEAEAKAHVESDTDEEWTALIQQIRDLLYKNTYELSDVPEGYVAMSDWWKEGLKHGLTSSALSRAVGGDRAYKAPLGEVFRTTYVQIGNRARKFLPPEAMHEDSFEMIRGTQKSPVLAGAAKAAKEKKASKKEVSTEGNEAVAMADGSFS